MTVKAQRDPATVRQTTANEAFVADRAIAGVQGRSATALANDAPYRLQALADLIRESPRVVEHAAVANHIHASARAETQREHLAQLFGRVAQRKRTHAPAGVPEPVRAAAKPATARVEGSPPTNGAALPDRLKHGIESLSGVSMEGVRVHYNSFCPAQLDAIAYAQGADIHLAPGEERQLPHEAWHVVQQAQGRVTGTWQTKGGVLVNDDAYLEREADRMGAKAAAWSERSTASGLGARDGGFGSSAASVGPATHFPAVVAQRRIRVGADVYTWDTARHFRRELMLTLAALDFPERGTRPMWERVKAWLTDPAEVRFTDFRAIVGKLYSDRLMEKRMIAGAATGPRALGDRPAFATGVTKLLELSEDESQARRHVISSSTLGRAIELAPANLATLNAWLERHDLPAQPDRHSALDARAARRRIWEYVHNHIGNLWVGPSMPNSAIGFIRGPILSAVSGARQYMVKHDSDNVPFATLTELLPKESPWRNESFARTWNTVRNTLLEQLAASANRDGWVDGFQAVALMVEWIRNADLDLPSARLGANYYSRLVSIYGRMVYPTEELFAEDGALDDFLRLSLTSGARDLSKKKPTSAKSLSFFSMVPHAVPDRLVGVGRIQDVSGDGMNCLIRALLVASGRRADDSVVGILREYLRSQGVAVHADMLDLAADAGAVLLSYMQAQGLIAADRGLVVHTPANRDPPIAVLDGANPIHLWLSDDHFRAVVPD